MFNFNSLLTFTVLALSMRANAAIGPVTDLAITNAEISPDGFSRQAVLAGGTFPGSLITGNKVCLTIYSKSLTSTKPTHSRVTTSKSMLSTLFPTLIC